MFCEFFTLCVVHYVQCFAKSFSETLSASVCCEETRSLSPFTLFHISRKQRLHWALSGWRTAWPFQIISTMCDQFSGTYSSQNKGTPAPPFHFDLAIFSLSSQSGLSWVFRRLLLTGSLTAHIRLNKSSCQFLVSHTECWRYTLLKVLANQTKWFSEGLFTTQSKITLNSYFRADKSDVPASPPAYSLPWAGGSRGSAGCVYAPHRCSLLCLPETHTHNLPWPLIQLCLTLQTSLSRRNISAPVEKKLWRLFY